MDYMIERSLIEVNILRQHTDYRNEGCLITDNILMLSVFGKTVVGVIRNFDDPDAKLDFRSRKEFTERQDAIDYYNELIDNVDKR